ncbi:Protein of unknown function DUF1376 [uncultured Caudovirales phage]|uniref:DUF1376 domain-containing protein n=1 Tax=uncultured Caudovirales phage TaxID=2100421 RepID=A0A6J7X623_9CAUD|nr:Protein of unknown function DUF1376 [uncultured Caudovirales phage]
MHYYSFHVSDYIHDTAHLSNEEDLAYRRLLDLYYTQEKPIPNRTHEVARRIRMGKNIEAVQTVLEEFFMFSLEHDFWFHKRCDETIAAYQAKAERNRAVGKLGGRPKTNPNETQTVSKDNPNHKPITNNHKPIKERATSVACPPDVNEQVWQDWLQLRKSKKASVTETVVKGARAEAAKLGWELEKFLVEWCTRGSQGLKAEWIAEKQTQNGLTKTGQRNANVLQGLTRGLLGGQSSVQLLK